MTSLWIGLSLALGASVALNVSYVLQHRGSVGAPAISVRSPMATLRSLLRSPWWAVGAGVGVAGWALHIGALAQAPLSLVQAFVAGGLALAVPLAAAVAGEVLGRREVRAVAVLVLGLILLAVGARRGQAHPAFSAAGLALWLGALGAGAGALAAGVRGARRPAALGLAGGLLYAAADMATKALTGESGLAEALSSAWLPITAAASVGAFFCFQRGLQTGAAVPVIALMTAGTNALSIAGGFAVFGDPFASGAIGMVAHGAGLALLAVGAWRLAPAQARLTTRT